MRQLLLAMLVCLGFTVPGWAQDLDPELDPAFLQAVSDRIDAIQGMDALFAACPADIFDTHSGWFSGWQDEGEIRSLQACRDDLAQCAQECLEGEDGRTCVYLAQLYESVAADTVLDTEELTARKVHAYACALGRPAGCTNRGGGIRNWTLEGDPFATMDVQPRDQCLFATFESACMAGDSWGCAMAGQAYANGEGVAAAPDMARARFRAACVAAGDPEFEACVFSNSIAEVLEAD